LQEVARLFHIAHHAAQEGGEVPFAALDRREEFVSTSSLASRSPSPTSIGTSSVSVGCAGRDMSLFVIYNALLINNTA
jgi:hypothetical protein